MTTARLSHQAARTLFATTAPDGVGPRAVALVQAVAYHETGYGSHWWRNCPGLVGSHNLGAIHGSPGVICTDKHRDGTPYEVSFRTYPSYLEGARDLWRVLWRSACIRRVLYDDSLDAKGLAHAMSRAGYFEAEPSQYAKGLSNALKAQRS